MEKSATLFTLYAKEDEPFAEQLTAALSLLRRKGLVKDYYDKEISPIESWDEQARLNFTYSNCLLFLVSPALLASGYYRDTKIQEAFLSAQQGQLKIIPLLIRYCDYSLDPLSQFEFLPANGHSVESTIWGNRENAWKEVTDGLVASITREIPVVPVAVSSTERVNQVPARRSGVRWLLQLLFSIVALAAMGGITYYLVNYEPADKGTAVVNPTNVADSIGISPATEALPAPVEPVEVPAEKIIQKTITPPKAARQKKVATKTTRETVPEEIPDTVAKTELPPPPPKTPTIKSAELEQMLFDFSQGKVAAGDFSDYLCNQLQTPVRFDKKTMTFQQMCMAIKEVKPKKIKKITVVSATYDKSCISALEVDLKKKGLFN